MSGAQVIVIWIIIGWTVFAVGFNVGAVVGYRVREKEEGSEGR
jgi:hypothetical protein